MMFTKGLQKYAHANNGVILLASGCTGSGIEFKIGDEISAFWSGRYDIGLAFAHEYICESNEVVQKHLLTQLLSGEQVHKPLFFDDITVLSDQGKCPTVPTGVVLKLPEKAIGWIGGFSCTSRSPKNARAREHVNCIQILDGRILHLVNGWYLNCLASCFVILERGRERFGML